LHVNRVGREQPGTVTRRFRVAKYSGFASRPEVKVSGFAFRPEAMDSGFVFRPEAKDSGFAFRPEAKDTARGFLLGFRRRAIDPAS
jgi:hypothetical protein